MAPIQVFVQIRGPHRCYGYYCAICPFSSGGNIIQKKKKKKKKKKKNPTQIMTCAPAYGLGTSKKKKKKKKNATQIMTCAPAYGLGTSKKELDPVPG